MGMSDGYVADRPEKILDNGPDDRRLIIALLAEGFRADQQGAFNRMCREFVYRLQAEPWYHDRGLGLAPYPGSGHQRLSPERGLE